MVVNPKEIVIINLFYNLPHFLVEFAHCVSHENSNWVTLDSAIKKKLKNAIYDKEFWLRRDSIHGTPAW